MRPTEWGVAPVRLLAHNAIRSGSALLSAAMRVHLSDSALADDLVRHFRSREYLVVREDDAVTIVPLNIVSGRADRMRFERDLAEWHESHPGVQALVEP